MEDLVRVLRASRCVLGRAGLLAKSAAGIEFRRHQVAYQGQTLCLGDLTEVVLDPRPLARVPGCLESVADPVNLVERVQRKLDMIGCRLGTHDGIPFSMTEHGLGEMESNPGS